MGTFVGALAPFTKALDIYVNFNKIAALPQAFYYSWQVVNNETIGLYYQYLTTVTLAGGSTAVIASQTATNLGLVASGANASYSNEQIANMTTAPSANEVETVVITIKRYTDSGYTTLYDTVSLLTINLHLYSDALPTVAVQSTDNFASGSVDGWSYGGSGNGPSFGTSSGTYYDATSGYSLGLETLAAVNSTNQYGNNTAVPFNGIYAYKAYTASNTYTDALIELFVKAGSGGAGWFVVEVDYADSTPTDYYAFYLPNTANWFQVVVKAKPNVQTTVKLAPDAGPYGNGCGEFCGTYNCGYAINIGTVRVIGKTSGTF
jgi:hypothetical protein